MGTTLTGAQINNTYTGLLKTSDNAVLGATEKVMGDGAGNDSTLSLGTASASFTGTLDLANCTVTGFSAGGGLELGSGTATQEGAPKSMQSGLSVTTISAQARGGGDIAIGEATTTPVGSTTWPTWNTAIGGQASCTSEKGLAVGFDSIASNKGHAFGFVAQSTGLESIAIGSGSVSNMYRSAVIGANMTAMWSQGLTVNQLAMANYANLNYADNAAAAAGGVPLGGVYHTDGALKIRVA